MWLGSNWPQSRAADTAEGGEASLLGRNIRCEGLGSARIPYGHLPIHCESASESAVSSWSSYVSGKQRAQGLTPPTAPLLSQVSFLQEYQ